MMVTVVTDIGAGVLDPLLDPGADHHLESMALKGQAKTDYQREYMRRRRAAKAAAQPQPKATKPTRHEIAALRAELAYWKKRAKTEVAYWKKRSKAERDRNFDLNMARIRGGGGVLSMSQRLHRAIAKALHPDRTTDKEERERLTALYQEYNALPIEVIPEETKARREAAERERGREQAEAYARGAAKFAERSRRAKEAHARRKARNSGTTGA